MAKVISSSPGSTGLKGDKGDIGLTGVAGTNGLDGAKGEKGDQGPQGIQGLKGDTGAKGDTGSFNGDITADQVTETATRKFQTPTQSAYNDATSSIQGQLNSKENAFSKNTGFNKNIGLGGSDIVGATTLLNQYSTTPVDWTATAFNSGQVVFYGGKQWIAKMATVAGDVPAVSSKWEEITFEALANKTVIVDAIPTGGSNNAVSSNGVFDALATKAPISSVHNPVTLGTANGLSLSTQQLSLGLASSGVTGALSGTDWNNFNNKQNALAIVSDAEMQTGTENTKFTTALRIASWFTWRLTQPFTFGSLTGIGDRVPQVDSTGLMTAPLSVEEAIVTDTDVINAIVAGTYNIGNSFKTSITPASSKTFFVGQIYYNGVYKYEAVANNISQRFSAS